MEGIPNKLYYKIGEVSQITDLPAYVLRFWETEFKKIKPKRTASGQRLYRKTDVDLILKIKHLLYEKKYTIPGAIQYLRSGKKKMKRESAEDIFSETRQKLIEIRNMLS